MNIHGYPSISMDFYEYPRISMDFHEYLKYHGFPVETKKSTNTNVLMPFSCSMNVMREYAFTDY